MAYKYTVTGDSRDAQRAIEALDKRVASLTEQNRRLTRAANSAASAATRGFRQQNSLAERAARGVQNIAAGYLSLNQATSLYLDFLRQKEELEKRALNTNVTLARAQQETIKNLAGLTSEEKQDILSVRVPDIANRVGLGRGGQAAVTSAIGAGFSASGDVDRTLKAVEAAAKLNKFTLEKIEPVAAGALDVARGSGIDDAKRNLGFLLAAGAQARITDPTDLAKNLAPIVSSGVASVPGQNRIEAAREIAALFTLITRAATQVRGESTGTAGNIVLKQMEDFFAEEGRIDPGTVFGRRAAISQDPELRKEFLDDLKGEAKFKKALELIFTDGSELSKELRGAKEAINFNSKLYDQTAREVSTLTPQGVLASGRSRGEGSVEQRDLSSPLKQTAFIREKTREALQATRGRGFESMGLFLKDKSSVRLTEEFSPGSALENSLDLLIARRQTIRGIRPVIEPLSTKSIDEFEEIENQRSSLRTRLLGGGAIPDLGQEEQEKLGQERVARIELIDKAIRNLIDTMNSLKDSNERVAKAKERTRGNQAEVLIPVE